MPGLLLSILLIVNGAGAPRAIADLPTPTPAPFPIIGRTRSKRYCQLELDRTNGAILVALTNDKIIATGIARLRSADLDQADLTIIARENTMRNLRAIAATIQTNMRAGNAQVTDLRALSIREPDAKRSPELKLLADQIDAVLDRQRAIGSDLAKLLTIVDGRYARANLDLLAHKGGQGGQNESDRRGLGSIDELAEHEPLNDVFTDVADDFTASTEEIGKLEDTAAIHAPKAVDGC